MPSVKINILMTPIAAETVPLLMSLENSVRRYKPAFATPIPKAYRLRPAVIHKYAWAETSVAAAAISRPATIGPAPSLIRYSTVRLPDRRASVTLPMISAPKIGTCNRP
ncbi:hypothetical protein D3C80_1716020 [compost metagenome]